METEVLQSFKILVSISFLGLLGSFMWLYKELVMKAKKLRSKLRKQGINGPTPTFLLGNIREIKEARDAVLKPVSDPETFPTSHNVAAILFPFLERWRKQFGQTFMFSLGTIQILHTNHPDMVRDITTCTSLDLGKPSYQLKRYGPLLGQGILTTNGDRWAHQRKILAPELYMEKVKGMVSLITESANMVLNSWDNMIEAQGGGVEIKIDHYMRKFSGDVISRACFGSNYSEGEQIFLKLRALQENMSRNNDIFSEIPGMRYLPTKSNKEAGKLVKEVRSLILQIVKERTELKYDTKDLLQMVIEGANNSNLSQNEIDQFIEDNCKNIYLAGYETTATAAIWLLMLLASNQEWQARVRAEVIEVCRGRVPDTHMLRKMKQLTMVIHESLRLYPPVSVVSREALKDMKFGDVHVPKNVKLWIIVVKIHTDPEIWGPDSYNFNPDRFVNGITGACKFPHLYLPFGVGPRMCLGQNLAMMELKILISLILSNFSFSLSPQYVHSPVLNLVLEPQHGVNLMVKKL